MLLYLSPVIALVVLAPMAAGDDCRCQFTGMRGWVFMYTNKYGEHLLRPYGSKFEVNYEKELAFFYPGYPISIYSLYIQDLKTNKMYIYPYENYIPTGECKKVNMPEDLMVPSCLPSSWHSRNSTYPRQLEFVPDINVKWQNNYRVDANNLCNVHAIHQVYNGYINLHMNVLIGGLNFGRMQPRYTLNTTNCQEEDLANLFYQAFEA